MTIRRLIILFVSLFLFGCTTVDVQPEEEYFTDFEYFPLEIGRFVEYNVNQTDYVESDSVVSEYQLKVIIVDSMLVNDRRVYILNKLKRLTENDNWDIELVISALIQDDNLLIQENNLLFNRLVFPLKENRMWDGNAFNNLYEDRYEMGNVRGSLEFSNQIYPETVTVIQNDNKDVIVKTDVRKMIYAKDIGLIYAESKIIEYCTENDCLGQQKINSGMKFKQTILNYGKE